jgi:hypothetical protein
MPGHVTLPSDLADLENRAYFVSSETGWMAQRTFLFYAHFLLYELRVYRAQMPVHLWNQRFLLILDGHTSRWTIEAIGMLRDASVDVLVLPSHCTHVLQPFDVSAAAPLKCKLAQLFESLVFTLTESELGLLMAERSESRWLADRRRTLFRAFLSTWDEAATERNILSGFRMAGIVPLNRNVPLANRNTRRILDNQMFPIPSDDPHELNCCLVSRDETLQFLSQNPRKMFPQESERILDPKGNGGCLLCVPHLPDAFYRPRPRLSGV